MNNGITMGKAALWYATNGISVFPLHSPDRGGCSCARRDCHSPGKHPLTERGFKDATTDLSQIMEWWDRHPSANIGIPTGAASGLLVVDVDPRNGGPVDRAELVRQFGQIPETAEVMTGGGGRHLFFRYRGGAVPKALAEGIDLKGDGGYVVAPPSLHPGGKRYEFDGLVGRNSVLNPAWLPTWLQERISTPRNGPRAQSTADTARWAKGERNNKLTSEAGVMRRRGLSREAIEAALLEENRRRCDTPLPDAEVRRIAESMARYEPAQGASEGEGANAGSLITRCIADIEPKPVRWLWLARIARGKVTIIAGNPGLGKSQITASIAAVVTTGGCWPVDGATCEPGDLLFLTAEDDAADTLRPRLEAAGADLQRVHIIEGVAVGYTGDGTRRNRVFSLQQDLPVLSQKLAELCNVAAVIIDPISAYLGDIDSHRNAEVRGLLTPLGELAARHDTAIIGISHLNKNTAGGGEALMRVSGSLGFVAAARAVYLVAPDQEDKARRLFLPMKNNLGPDATGLAYHIEEVAVQCEAGPLKTSRVVWESGPVAVTADEVMQPGATQKASVVGEVEDWLRGILADGPIPATEVFERANAEGFSKRTLKRAGRKLGIESSKAGMNGGWSWWLPKSATMPEECQETNLAPFDEVGTLAESPR